jgi:hypothetical protein
MRMKEMVLLQMLSLEEFLERLQQKSRREARRRAEMADTPMKTKISN